MGILQFLVVCVAVLVAILEAPHHMAQSYLAPCRGGEEGTLCAVLGEEEFVCPASMKGLVSCSVPSRELHTARNCFGSRPQGKLVPLDGGRTQYTEEQVSKRQRVESALVWNRAPFWASVFHRPWVNMKLIARGHESFEASSELEVRIQDIQPDGSVLPGVAKISSFNYFDYTDAPLCHVLADVIPTFLYAVAHASQPCKINLQLT